jgi:hypothetical protein
MGNDEAPAFAWLRRAKRMIRLAISWTPNESVEAAMSAAELWQLRIPSDPMAVEPTQKRATRAPLHYGQSITDRDRFSHTAMLYNSEGVESRIQLNMASGTCQRGSVLISLAWRTCSVGCELMAHYINNK